MKGTWIFMVPQGWPKIWFHCKHIIENCFQTGNKAQVALSKGFTGFFPQ